MAKERTLDIINAEINLMNEVISGQQSQVSGLNNIFNIKKRNLDLDELARSNQQKASLLRERYNKALKDTTNYNKANLDAMRKEAQDAEKNCQVP